MDGDPIQCGLYVLLFGFGGFFFVYLFAFLKTEGNNKKLSL